MKTNGLNASAFPGKNIPGTRNGPENRRNKIYPDAERKTRRGRHFPRARARFFSSGGFSFRIRSESDRSRIDLGCFDFTDREFRKARRNKSLIVERRACRVLPPLRSADCAHACVLTFPYQAGRPTLCLAIRLIADKRVCLFKVKAECNARAERRPLFS